MPISNKLNALFATPSKTSERVSCYKNFTSKYDPFYFKKQLHLDNRVIIYSKTFRFNSLTHFGTELDDFKKQYGKPVFNILSNYNFNVRTLVYKTKIAGVSCRANLIFYKEKLILFNYVFNKLSKRAHRMVCQYAISKFGFKFDQDDYNVVDSYNNRLAIDRNDHEIIFNFYSPLNKIQASFENNYGNTKLISFQDKKEKQSKTS